MSISGAFDVGGLCNTLREMSSIIAGSLRICGACVWNTAGENLRGKFIWGGGEGEQHLSLALQLHGCSSLTLEDWFSTLAAHQNNLGSFYKLMMSSPPHTS